MNVIYHHRTAGDRVERTHIMGVVNAFRAMGHRVFISSPPGCDPERRHAPPAPAAPKKSGDDANAVGLRAGLKRHARHTPPLFFELTELAYNLWSFADMARLASRARPHLIYERTTANSVAPTLLAMLLRVPIVQEINVTADVGRLRPLALRRLTRALERWVMRRAAAQVAVSRRFRELLIAAGLPRSEEALVTPNAVSPELFRPDAPPPAAGERLKAPGEMLFGYVGAFVPYHGLERLARVAPRIAREFPNSRWLLVGDGVMRDSLQKMVAANGLGDRFIFAGAVPHEAIPGWIALMDVCVLPQSNPHGSPMKLLEYMAMGRAVVAPRLGPVEEVTRHGVNGLLFAPDDETDFAEQLVALGKDAELRRRLGEQARRDVLTQHTWEANVRRCLELLRRKGARLPVESVAGTSAAPQAENAGARP